MRKKPLVSIAMITYNHENFIEQSLQSVLSQETDFDFEVVIGDDASTDRTADIIREHVDKFGDTIVPIFREENIGGLANILDLYSRCTGKYIAHLDGDDMMLPHKLQIQVDIMERNPSFAICAHKVHITKEAKPDLENYSEFDAQVPIEYNVHDLEYLLLNGPFFPHCSKLFRTSSMPVNGFSFKPKTKALDWSFHVQNAFQGDIAFISSHVLGIYRKHEGGVTNCSADELIYLRYGHDLAIEHAKLSGLVSDEVILTSYKNHYCGFAYGLLLKNSHDNFLKHIELAYSYGPLSFKQGLLYKIRKYKKLVTGLVLLRSKIILMFR